MPSAGLMFIGDFGVLNISKNIFKYLLRYIGSIRFVVLINF